MQNLKVLRTISLLLVFALVIFSCATSGSKTDNMEFGITAEAVTKGIRISFNNLPQDTTHMWIGISTWEYDEGEEPIPPFYKQFSSYAAITDTGVMGWVNSSEKLDKIKETGSLIFPFVKTGVRHNISVTIYTNDEFNAMRGEIAGENYPRTVNTEVIANNGIYFNRNDVNLVLNDSNSIAVLTTEPVFTSDVIYDEQKYSFGVIVHAGGGRSIGIGDHHYPQGLSQNGLTWVFEPYLTETLRKDDAANEWLGNGSHPANADVYANIKYDDIIWRVEIAKSTVFSFSLW